MQQQAREAGPAAGRVARARQGSTAGQPVDFPAEAQDCPRCGAALRVQKSKTRQVATLTTGTIEARETRKRCARCPSGPVEVSRQLAALAPPRQRYGYDLIVWAGLARYHRHQQRREIRAELARRGIQLADGSVSQLCDRFLRALEALHRQRAPALRAAMAGGYPLHLDATSDRGKGGLFLCLDGWRGWVLHAVKVSSENAAELQPAIESTLAAFGPPVAFQRDLGSAGAKAVAGVRDPAIPDLVCHYHFLAAVGKKLLDVEYAALRSELRRSGVRSGLRELLRELRAAGRCERLREDLPALLLWVLEGEGRKHLPYPFALPHWDFYRRCGQFRQQVQRRLPRPRSRLEQRVLRRADTVLAALERAGRIAWAVPRLESHWLVFNELRDVLRLRDDELPHGNRCPLSAPRSPASVATHLQSIASATKAYQDGLRQRVAAPPAAAAALPEPLPEAVVLGYLDRYYDSLCGHPVVLDSAGRVVQVVARTNNVAEHFFASAKQKLRRRLGRAHLGRDMQDQPAQAALAANLLCSEYVRILCGTLDCLPQAFAELDRQALAATTPLQRNNRDANLRRRNRAWAADS